MSTKSAEATFRRALVIRERLLGPDNSGLITTVEGLAYAQFGEKKYDEAESGIQAAAGVVAGFDGRSGASDGCADAG